MIEIVALAAGFGCGLYILSVIRRVSETRPLTADILTMLTLGVAAITVGLSIRQEHYLSYSFSRYSLLFGTSFSFGPTYEWLR